MSQRDSGASLVATIGKFIPYLWPPREDAIRRRVIIAFVLLVAQKLTNVAVPLIYGEAVNTVASEDFIFATLLGIIGAYAGVRLLQQIFDEFKFYVFARVAQRAIRTLALKTFRHLHGLSLRFHLDRQTGGLSRVIERGVKSIEFLLTFALFNIVPTVLEIAFVCAIFWWLFNAYFALAIVLTIGGYVVYTIAVTEWRIKYRRRMNEHDKHANVRAVDSLLNYETVKYFNAEEYEAQRYDAAMCKYEDAAVKNRTSLSLLNIGQGAIIAVGIVVIMGMAGAGVSRGDYSIGLFASVNMYLLQLYLPLNFLGTVYREIRQALIDMEEMFSLLDVPPDVEDADGAPALRVNGATVEFRGISFGYGRGDILRDVSFTIPGGTKTAVVGPSGAGKSTIARLLYRFYDPQAGAILIDGQNIRDCKQQSVRAAIGIVPQDTVLFNDSLRYNILYGNPDADEDEVRQAANSADIEKFIAALPEKYNTMVGERGLKLSGGEKQRVAIARALLKNPAIFLFDEATSALDSNTEKNIQSALNHISRARTTLVIAHRLSTVVDADEIIVLADGRIAERGTHRWLLEHKGLYASMWERQQETPPVKADATIKREIGWNA